MKTRPMLKLAVANRLIKPTASIRRVRKPTDGVTAPKKLAIKSILVPTDFSASADEAIKYAAKLAELFGAQITLLYVVEPMPVDFEAFPLALEDDRSMRAARTRLELEAQRDLPPANFAQALVRLGRPFHEITEAARTLKVDLIVIATHGYTGLKHVVMGSTAERVVRYAPCPVLTVRPVETRATKD